MNIAPIMAATALRTCQPCNHEELITIAHQLQTLLQKPGALSEKCTRVCVDLLDEIVGQIENDQIDQQKEAAWTDKWIETNRRAFGFMRAAA